VAVTPEIEADIMRLHDQNPKRFSPFRVAKQVGATMAEVIATVNQNKVIEGTDFSGTISRVGLLRFIVASRPYGSWDNTDEGVIEARRRYDAGTHTMATHRENGWMHLCSIPLRRPVRAVRRYYATEAA
jgi:hypothetical protein